MPTKEPKYPLYAANTIALDEQIVLLRRRGLKHREVCEELGVDVTFTSQVLKRMRLRRDCLQSERSIYDIANGERVEMENNERARRVKIYAEQFEQTGQVTYLS